MNRFLSSVIIVYALALTGVQAQDADSSSNTASSSSCESLTDKCRSLSLGTDKNPDLCSCKTICASAQKACLQENKTDQLDTASLYALYCKKSCKKYKQQEEQKKGSSSTKSE
ncbi:MAG: hypothetical protein K2Y08_00490 [Alphaproteobacteria bacterium]|nr:hypothetical protein [Alphaproteobacteria bacterium]